MLIFLNNFKKKIGDNYSDDDLKEFVKNTLNAGQVCDMVILLPPLGGYVFQAFVCLSVSTFT